MNSVLLLTGLLLGTTAAVSRYEDLAPLLKQNDRQEIFSLSRSAMSFGCSVASIDVVRSCYAIFLDTFNLPLDAAGKLPPYIYFLQATTLVSFYNICQPTNSLMNCLSTRAQSECLNIATFRILTYNDNDAFSYLSAFAAFEYICGSGYQEFVHNEECFMRTTNDVLMRQKLSQCGLLIDAATPADVCQNGLLDAQCVRDVYLSFCGPQLGHGMCEVRVNFIRRLQIVDLNCLSELNLICNAVIPTNSFAATFPLSYSSSITIVTTIFACLIAYFAL